jgi:hypothetical protein
MMTHLHRAWSAASRGRTLASFATVLVALAAHVAGGQSNLSSQGFGYPPGQFSSRALGTGAAIGELDPLSPINPATIAVMGARTVYFQAQPEYRTVTGPEGTERTTTARYPVVFGAIPIGSSWMISLGSSTLLDRTAATTVTTTVPISNTESELTTTSSKVDGAINDVRIAAAWAPTSWLRAGVGAHAIAGHNRVTLEQTFQDSTQFASFTQQRLLGYGGAAVSGGVELVSKNFNASLSGRWGGNLHLSVEDTTISSARVPDRFGVSVAYTGIASSTIAVRTSYDSWSALNGLGSPGMSAVNSWDSSIGGDFAGPRFGNQIVFLRTGFRMRTLPFQAAGQNVDEKSVSAGVGTQFAANHVLADLAVIRAVRNADIGASERAWTISIGISVRP